MHVCLLTKALLYSSPFYVHCTALHGFFDDSQIPLYTQATELVKYLLKWQPSSPEADVYTRLQDLFKDM
jgi:hypothetical protein